MPFNIKTFKSNLFKYGVLQNNKFELIVNPPPIMGPDPIVTHQHTFRIDETIAPGIEIMTADVQRYGIGPTQKQVITAQFKEMPISIICDKNSNIPKFWYAWVKNIFDFTSTDDNGSIEEFPEYTAEYKDDFASTMQLIVYEATGKKSITYNFYDIYPMKISEIPLSWSSQDELIKLSIILTYKEYTIVNKSLGLGGERY